jgi:ubiquinone/menaquinone biosynthesis C-methylase UbiE
MDNTYYDLHSPKVVSMIDELPFWSAPFGLSLLAGIKYRKHMKVLDIGSGTGFPSVEVAMRLGHTSKVYGIDPWRSAISRTNQKCETYGVDNLEIIKGHAEDLPFDDDFFDLIVSNNGINNVDDMEATLEECSRVAKPGAQFILSVNRKDTMKEFYQVYKSVLLEEGAHDTIVKMQEHIYKKRKPVNELCSLLRKYGFKVRGERTESFEYTFADGDAFFNHFIIKLAFIGPWMEIVNVNRQ